MRLITILFLLCFSISGMSQEVRVGLYWSQNITNVIITPTKGEYKLTIDGKMTAFLDAESLLQVMCSNDSVFVKVNSQDFIRASKILFASYDSSHFKIRSVSPDLAVKSFLGSLEIVSSKNLLKIVNYVDLESYIAGVVESEVGPKAPPEYYKTQAILCRTYALSHTRRHELEGFQVCDKVHCQVYKSRSQKNAQILNAVKKTKGQVLVDDKLEFVTAAFHSNCGGQTANSEDVWNKPVSYLRSVRDTFCLREPNARWSKEIPAEKWVSYFQTACACPASDSNYRKVFCSVDSDTRLSFIGDQQFKVMTRDLRTGFNLKSAYFKVNAADDKIQLSGKGYGHGVGLCQEGAMRMARLGYDYSKILHFYYTGVNIVPLSEVDFFRHE